MSTSTKTKTVKAELNGHASNGSAKKSERLPVMKTYKIFIGGKFPRTESGRFYQPKGSDDKPLANVGRSSRKDVRDAVIAARSALGGWAGRSAFNRGQILYRIGEMLEGRRAQFVSEIMLHPSTGSGRQHTRNEAEAQVSAAIDRWLHYAGWCDKYQALFSSVNPTNSSHFNFSVYEPTGVVGVMAPEGSALLGLVSTIAPVIAGGNTCIVVASESMPLPAVTFTEVLATSDLPGGVVNLLTGFRSELLKPLVTHMDINAIVVDGATKDERTMLEQEAICNLKRVVYPKVSDWNKEEGQSPYFILDTQEVKTTWHPIEKGQGGGGGYSSHVHLLPRSSNRNVMRAAGTVLVALISLVLVWINVAIHCAPPVGSTEEVDALRAQLAYLEPRVHDDVPQRMQRLFPEGSAFSYALYALSWSGLAARIPGDDSLRAHAAREVRWAYEHLDSEASRAQFSGLLQPPFGVFYAGWRNQVLAALVSLEPSDTTLARSFDRESTLIAEAFAGSATPSLESYPGQAWPADAVVALHSLRLHERLRDADHDVVIARWVQQARAHRDEREMIPHAWHAGTGATMQPGRGSSLALINVFLPDIDSALAAEQFSAWRGYCITETFGVPAVREHPLGVNASGDVDSGPLILGYGPAATIVGAAACKRNGDEFHATECARTVHGFGFATGGSERRYLFGALPIADLFIAWGLSIPSEQLQGPPPGYQRFHAWCAVLILVLWSPWIFRWWRRGRMRSLQTSAGSPPGDPAAGR